jgi:HEAT repeat protein
MSDRFLWKWLAILLGSSTLFLAVILPSWSPFSDGLQQDLREGGLGDNSLKFELFQGSEGKVPADPTANANKPNVENNKGDFGTIFQSTDEPKKPPTASLDTELNVDGLEYIFTQLAHPDWETRLKAVKSLAELNNAIVIPGLIDRVLNDVSTHVRWRSIESLKAHDSYRDEIISLLLAGLKEREPEIVKNSAVALALYGNEQAKDHLKIMLQDELEIRRREAVFALGEFGSADIIFYLYPVLDQNLESDESIREEAVKVIGRIGNSQSIPYLLGVLGSDVNEGVRVHSAIALGNLGDLTIVAKLEELYLNEQSLLVLPHIRASVNRLKTKNGEI